MIAPGSTKLPPGPLRFGWIVAPPLFGVLRRWTFLLFAALAIALSSAERGPASAASHPGDHARFETVKAVLGAPERASSRSGARIDDGGEPKATLPPPPVPAPPASALTPRPRAAVIACETRTFRNEARGPPRLAG